MTDEEGQAVSLPGQHDGELLLYDFFKHLTSLSILALGGVLIVAQGADPADVKPELVAGVLIFISGAGAFAFTGSIEIVRARSTNTPLRPSIDRTRKVAPALLALGVGMFLAMFVDSLS